MNINFICDMLIDQGRYIGGDPMGFKCTNSATLKIGNHLLCDRCKQLYLNRSQRLHFPRNGTYLQQKKMIEEIAIVEEE